MVHMHYGISHKSLSVIGYTYMNTVGVSLTLQAGGELHVVLEVVKTS